MERTVAVQIGAKTVYSKISWSETAEDVIRRLSHHAKSTNSSYILLEKWNGCSRRINPQEKVMKVLDGWGYGIEIDKPLLELTQKASNKLYKPRRIKRRYHCCRVAARKRNPPKPLQPRSKKAAMRDILMMIKRLKKQLFDYQILTIPSQPPLEQLALSANISSLPPELEDDFVALQEGLMEENRENSDLLRRKEELNRNILSQQRELDSLNESISLLEAKVRNEEHKVTRLIETTGPPELEGAQKELTKLRNDFSMRSKLNKLQASKLQEVSNNVLKVEREIQEVTEEIEKLQLRTEF